MARLHYIQAFMNYLQVLVWNYSLVVARYITRLTNTPSLKPTTRREIQYLLTMAEEDDKRPDTSPFAGFTTQIYFREGPDFVVPTSLIRKCPKLVPEKARWPPSAIRLDDITASIAHVIFYYLLTGTYQSLRPKGTSSHERLGDELKTGVQSYNAARTYDLPELQELAKDEIQRLAQELPFPLVLNLLRNLHLDPYEREAWLDDYVQSGLKNLFQTPTAFLDLTATQVENDVVSFSNIILKSLANLLSNESALSHKDIVVTPAATPEPAAIEAEPNHEEPLREQLLPEDEPVLVEVDTRIEEPNNEVQVQDQVEQPAPPEVEWEPTPEAAPEPEPEPIPEDPVPDDIYDHTLKHVQEPAHDLSYTNTPELQEIAPEPESEQTKTAASWWGWPADKTTEPKEDDPVSAPPEPIESKQEPEPEPELTVPEGREEPAIEYPEPVPVRDFSHVLEHQQPPTPDNNDAPAPAAAVPATSTPEPVARPVEAAVERIKSKKRLSLFRSATEPADKTPDSQSQSSRVQTPEPATTTRPVSSSEPKAEDTKDSKLEAAKESVKGAVDDAAAALLSSASSTASATPKKTKKKKKSLFYRSDVL
ncbi:hypothetical protein F5Y08DRAFT_48769 [Xylaria arbuscula]|nr:hypothetical protein F5Y08DRAFT_48769 [Xylaria arbuscula]